MKLSATLTALAVLFAFPANAAPNCAQINDVHDILKGRYQEELIAEGYNEHGELIQWWGNSSTGSWTAIVSNGPMACIVAQGDKFKRVSLRPNV